MSQELQARNVASMQVDEAVKVSKRIHSSQHTASSSSSHKSSNKVQQDSKRRVLHVDAMSVDDCGDLQTSRSMPLVGGVVRETEVSGVAGRLCGDTAAQGTSASGLHPSQWLAGTGGPEVAATDVADAQVSQGDNSSIGHFLVVGGRSFGPCVDN